MINGEPPYNELNRYAAMFKIGNEGLNPPFPEGTSDHCVESLQSVFKRNPTVDLQQLIFLATDLF